MKTALYIVLAIFAFGFLIFIHEGGHFLFARLFKVKIFEFSIGMGPRLLKKTSKKSGIEYSLRALPIGGFVSMAGEDEDSDDPNALTKKPVWQRIIITAAGAAVNLIAGILVMSILVFSGSNLGSTVIYDFADGAVSEESGLMAGDRVVQVAGKNVHIADELLYEIMRLGIEPIDITVIRDGEKIVIEDVEFAQMSSEGVAFGEPDFGVYSEKRTFPNLVKHSFYRSTYTVQMIWESLYDLVTGRYGVEAVSGPVGVTGALTEAAETGGAYSFIYLVVVISMNLGIMNLLPLPALDGGRLVFLIIEGIRRKPLNRTVEGYIHTAGLALLMVLMVLICVKDVINLF